MDPETNESISSASTSPTNSQISNSPRNSDVSPSSPTQSPTTTALFPANGDALSYQSPSLSFVNQSNDDGASEDDEKDAQQNGFSEEEGLSHDEEGLEVSGTKSTITIRSQKQDQENVNSPLDSSRKSTLSQFDSPLIVRSSSLVLSHSTLPSKQKKTRIGRKKPSAIKGVTVPKNTKKTYPQSKSTTNQISSAPKTRKRKGSLLKVSIRTKRDQEKIKTSQPDKSSSSIDSTRSLASRRGVIAPPHNGSESSSPLLTKTRSVRDTNIMQDSFKQCAPHPSPREQKMSIQIPQRDSQDWMPSEWNEGERSLNSATLSSDSSSRNIFHGGMIPRVSSPTKPGVDTDRMQYHEESMHWAALKAKQYEMTPPTTASSASFGHMEAFSPDTTPRGKSNRTHTISRLRNSNHFRSLSLFSSDEDEDRLHVDPSSYSPLKGTSSHKYPSQNIGGNTHSNQDTMKISGQNVRNHDAPTKDISDFSSHFFATNAPTARKKYHPLTYIKSSRRQAFKRRFKQLVQAYSSAHETNPQILKKRYEFLIRSLADAEMIERQKPQGNFRSKTTRFQDPKSETLTNPSVTQYSPHESKDLILSRPKSAVPFSRQGTPRFVEITPLNTRICYGQQDSGGDSHTHGERGRSLNRRPASAWAKAPERFDHRPASAHLTRSKAKKPLLNMEPNKLTDLEYMIHQMEMKNEEMDDRLVRLVETFDHFQQEDFMTEAQLEEHLQTVESSKKKHAGSSINQQRTHSTSRRRPQPRSKTRR